MGEDKPEISQDFRDNLPESVPYMTPEEKLYHFGPEKMPTSAIERERILTHQKLDELGVPRIAEKDIGGGEKAMHEFRLHGRLRLLQERLKELDIVDPFPKEPQTQQVSRESPKSPKE